tara:strand:- start:59 stop:454 length:396 start_codon:yes stop_codon:yes gene_type:complete
MPSPSVTVRLDQETYKTMVKLAKIENKNLAQFTRELIEQSLDKREDAEDSLLNEIRAMRMQLEDLTARAVKASAGSKYFSRLSTSYLQDLTSLVTTEKLLDQKSKKQQMAQFETKSAEFEQHFLEGSWEEL